MFCKISLGKRHLAAATEPATTAHGIQIDAEAAGRVENGRAELKRAALARWREYNFCLILAHKTSRQTA